MWRASLMHMNSSRCPSWTCTLSWSTLYVFFSLHEDDVLKISKMTPSTISFFKTCLQWVWLELVLLLEHSSIIPSIFIRMMSWRCTWENIQYSSSRHACHRLKPHLTNLLDHTLNMTWSTLDLHCFLLLFAFKPTYGLQALPMAKTYKYNSMQILVHRDCH